MEPTDAELDAIRFDLVAFTAEGRRLESHPKLRLLPPPDDEENE